MSAYITQMEDCIENLKDESHEYMTEEVDLIKDDYVDQIANLKEEMRDEIKERKSEIRDELELNFPDVERV